LDSTTGLVPQWNESVRQKIKAVVSLSGPANLDDWNNPGMISGTVLMKFENVLDNYVNLPDQDHTHSTLLAASPWNLVNTGMATSSPPVLLYATQEDPVPYEQANVMYTALTTAFGASPKFMRYVLADTTGLHAFDYWHTQNTISTPQDCVSHQVILFLQAYP
jgi:hypothetical protein